MGTIGKLVAAHNRRVEIINRLGRIAVLNDYRHFKPSGYSSEGSRFWASVNENNARHWDISTRAARLANELEAIDRVLSEYGGLGLSVADSVRLTARQIEIENELYWLEKT
jgi:hypothetical protein